MLGGILAVKLVRGKTTATLKWERISRCYYMEVRWTRVRRRPEINLHVARPRALLLARLWIVEKIAPEWRGRVVLLVV